jgi:iron complex outermembrane receptor protein
MAHHALSPRAARRLAPHSLALAALAALQAPLAAQPVERITVTGKLEPPPASVAGFGDVPLAKLPLQAESFGQGLLLDQGASALSALTRLDASVGDAYNSPGYWSALTVRGFVLDNRVNYQRDGLPMNAETAVSLDNKERIELLKGITGAQAGISAPGGLANLVVKRPRGSEHASVLLGYTERASFKAALDAERRLGDTVDLRVNAAVETLEPQLRDAKGERQMLAAAIRARLGEGQLDAEVEWSHQSQPSMPGFSMLGNSVPDARSIDPRLNLNNQAWSEPVVFDGTTASLRWTQALGADWQLVAHAMGQQLRTDDHIAFPYGCDKEGNYDRYCEDGSFDLYDYRSEGERRDQLSAALALKGRATLAGMAHELSTGLSWSDFRLHAGEQVYGYAGEGSIDGHAQVGPTTDAPYATAGRRERSAELHLRDRIELTAATQLWLGVRHSRLDRAADDGLPYRQSFTTPWLALSQQLGAHALVYASWGQGVETDVVPNREDYVDAGRPLPALKSRQTELGLKFNQRSWNASVAVFDIHRPRAEDTCSGDTGLCERRIDGTAHHLGLEASGEMRWGTFGLQGSAMWLRARREGASDDSLNGLVPTNVAQRSLRLLASWDVGGLPGLSALASLSHEGPRYVLPDNSARTPGWTTVGLAARHTTRVSGHDWTLRAGVDNLFDRRAWKESPYQFSHVYLYPLEPRTFRASVQASF